MNRGLLRQVRRILEEEGVQLRDSRINGSGHLKVLAARGHAQKEFVTGSNPGDHRTWMNFRAEVRRWARQTQTTR